MNEDDLPFTFNCFTSTSGSTNIINLTCDYNENCEKIKKGFTISFLIKSNSKASCNTNDSEVESTSEGLSWIIKDLDETKQPSLEIKTTESANNLFPLTVSLKLDYSILGVSAQAYDENKEEMLMSMSTICESQNMIISFD